MTNLLKQDADIGLKKTAVGTLSMAKYQADIALRVLDRIAEGQTLKEVCAAPGMPTRQTIYRWVALYPEFSKAYYAARELSAQSLEEDALEMAQTLKGANDFTGTKVRAFEVAMGQFRWSAARRDPRRYGQAAEGRIVIPIQINTTLDLGSADAGGMTTPDGDNVYSLRSKVEAITEVPDRRTQDLEDLQGKLDSESDRDDNEPLADPYGLPATVQSPKLAQTARPPRRKKGHTKSLSQIKRQQTVARMKAEGIASKR